MSEGRDKKKDERGREAREKTVVFFGLVKKRGDANEKNDAKQNMRELFFLR